MSSRLIRKAILILKWASDANVALGNGVAWLMLGIVLVQFIVVVLRYIFGIGSLMLQESIVYMHGTAFLLGAAYTLAQNKHVRVDIFYAAASERRRRLIDSLGTAFFLIPVAVLVFWTSWPYVELSWSIRESSQETSGLPGIFLLKSIILVFAAQLFFQGCYVFAYSLCEYVKLGKLALSDAAPSERDGQEG